MAEGSAGLAGLLAAAEVRMPVESVEAVAFELARRLGARSVSFLITDFTGNAVVRLSNADAGEERERIRLPGTVYGHVLREQRVAVRRGGHPDGQVQIVAPVTNRGDAIGLLEVFLPKAPEPATVQAVVESAHALAYILIANRRFTDLYQWGRRILPMNLAAEIQNTLLPDSLTCEGPQFTVSGELIPTEEIAGDTFDHSLDRHTLHVSITDAMGHDVRAALPSSPT
jgi:hypothetical protein